MSSQQANTATLSPASSTLVHKITAPGSKHAPGRRTIASAEKTEFPRHGEAPLRRSAIPPLPETVASPIVNNVLRSPGFELDLDTRAHMESRLGHDFSRVRIHTGSRAAESARAVDALAYTVGSEVVFAAGCYQPSTPTGRDLLAHELAHVAQQRTAPWGVPTDRLRISDPADPTEREAERAASGHGPVRFNAPAHVARYPAEEGSGLAARAKAAFYRGIISALRGSQRTLVSGLRRAARRLPEDARAIVDGIIDVVEAVTDIVISLFLAVIALNVGVISGLAGLVEGVFRMAAGLLTGIALFIAGLATGDMGAAKLWLEDLYHAIVGIPGAIKALYERWMAEFRTASTDRQTIMIGELTGQIIALLLPFLISGGAAAGGRAATVAEVSTGAARAGATVARPALTLIRGGGEAASVATEPARLAPIVRGTSALKVAPEVAPEVAPVIRPVPRLVPPPPATEAAAAEAATAAARSSRAAAVGTAVGTGTAARLAPEPEEERERPRAYPLCWALQLGPVTQRFFVRTRSERDEEEAKQARMQLEWRRFRDPDFDPGRFHVHHVVPLFLGGPDDLRANGTTLYKELHLRGHRVLQFQPQMLTPPSPLPPLPADIYTHPAGTRYVLTGYKREPSETC